MSFWTVWEGDELLGCGALMQHSADHAEIKSMRSALAHRGKGAGVSMLAYIIEESRRRGYARLSLETGSAEPFTPSRALYTRFGFRECGPFADYVPDPHSVFMTLEL
jgi:putative acetyltransferase